MNDDHDDRKIIDMEKNNGPLYGRRAKNCHCSFCIFMSVGFCPSSFKFFPLRTATSRTSYTNFSSELQRRVLIVFLSFIVVIVDVVDDDVVLCCCCCCCFFFRGRELIAPPPSPPKPRSLFLNLQRITFRGFSFSFQDN